MTPTELTEARESLHLTQRKLAEVLGVHPNLINRWEHGKAKIPPYLHLALAHLSHLTAPPVADVTGRDAPRAILDAGNRASACDHPGIARGGNASRTIPSLAYPQT